MVELVLVIKRGLIRMGATFISTSSQAEQYIGPLKQDSQTYTTAREAKESMAGYILGLARLSNLAVAHGLGKPNFENQINDILVDYANIKAGIAWGTKSEFDKNNLRRNIVGLLERAYPGRVDGIELAGQTHAMNIDIFLNAALISQLAQTS